MAYLFKCPNKIVNIIGTDTAACYLVREGMDAMEMDNPNSFPQSNFENNPNSLSSSRGSC